MMQKFMVWSKISPTAKDKLKPNIDLRSWDDLEIAEKEKVIRHFTTKGWFKDYDHIVNCIIQLNDNYKLHTYGEIFFNHGGPHTSYGHYEDCCKKSAMQDFIGIIKNADSDVTLELLSFYADGLIKQYYLDGEVDEESIENAHADFDRFANATNDISDHFGVNLNLTRQGFVPKQEKIVSELVVQPVFDSLVGKKWIPVQTEFSDALKEYRMANPKSYSNAITHLVSALQAYLQIKINGSTGKGSIDALVRSGVSGGLLPNDELSKKVISGLQSTVMEYRQKKGDAHPKKEYADEESVRLLLNIVSVFIQHCNSAHATK